MLPTAAAWLICLLLLSSSSGAFAAERSPHIFYGVNVDICLIDPSSPDYVRNSRHEDLIDIAHHLGINLFRITNAPCMHGRSYKHEWKIVLRKMQKEGIDAIITTEPPPQTRSGENGKRAMVRFIVSLVKDYRFGAYPNVYGIDILNEPLLDNHNIVLIKKAIKQIKAIYPHLRVTIGGWRTKPGTGSCPATFKGRYCWNRPEDGKVLAGLLDYYSVHIYGYDRPMNGPYPNAFARTAHFLDKILPLANGKPVIIEEYGADNGTAVSDQGTLGSPQLQANVTGGVLRAVEAYRNRNVIGSAQWAFYNRSYQTGTAGWQLVCDRGSIVYPAAYVIQKYSTGSSDKPVNLPLPIENRAYIFGNASNGTSVSLHRGDIAGLLLGPVGPGRYTMTFDRASLFSLTEPFIYDESHHYYVATLRAKMPGTTEVRIVRGHCNVNCQPFHIALTVLPSLGSRRWRSARTFSTTSSRGCARTAIPMRSIVPADASSRRPYDDHG